MVDTDRQQEDQDNVAITREYCKTELGALARNFHLRLSRIEAAIKGAAAEHICSRHDCGLCDARDLINGTSDWALDDNDYELPTPPPKPDPRPSFRIKEIDPSALPPIEEAERGDF